jgi:hypothetical protein
MPTLTPGVGRKRLLAAELVEESVREIDRRCKVLDADVLIWGMRS